MSKMPGPAEQIIAEAAVEEDNLTIPLIDFSNFLQGNPDARKAAADEVLKGFQTSGFIYLSNHGIPEDTVSEIFANSATFFEKSKQEKEKLNWTSPEANRGYSGFGREKVTNLTDKDEVENLRVSAPDIKESLEIGKEDPQFPNQWPNGEVEFKKTMLTFFDTCKILHQEVMRAVAVGLDIDESWFDPYTAEGDNTLRLLHYPAVKKSVFLENSAQVRAGAHSDYGSITLLFQDSRGGLQVQSPKGSFINATPIPRTIVVNAGDLLARWSNDAIKSTIHRVVEPPAPVDGEEHPARYSIAYFCNPDFTKTIDAIPGTFAQGKKYEPVNSGEYLVQRLQATY